jgi:hypothetical protein
MTSQSPADLEQVRDALLSWPLLTLLDLDTDPGAARTVRRHAGQVLREWALPALADDTELVVSEIAANAVAASAVAGLARFRLWMLSDGARAAVFVWDGSPERPAPAAPGADAESGRGLQLVEAVSADWGWYVPEDGQGKVVWAIIDSSKDAENEKEF